MTYPRHNGGCSPTVFVVDDDEDMRQSVAYLADALDLSVETYADPTSFLEQFDPTRAGVLVLDLKLNGMNGLDVLQQLRASGAEMPVIFITGFADVPTAVQAMKDRQAFEFLQKPVRDDVLIVQIQAAIEKDRQRRELGAERLDLRRRAARLTGRERQVMNLIANGHSSRTIGAQLQISPRTADAHRDKVAKKMEAKNSAELVRKWTLSQDD